jgi:hypothetical protein
MLVASGRLTLRANWVGDRSGGNDVVATAEHMIILS